jgi:hypothetical protein
MPHYKCGACRIRLQIVQPPPAPIVVFCPECRSALDHVADLSELIGLRRIAVAQESKGTGVESPAPYPEPSSAAAIALPHPRTTR